ncbi:hypothetical protein [Ramlibacter sp.]|uniref:hypothetical protein n=1 Tax=Ramlibacter sp. TaxID=1917967 RepID=UPI00262E5119|nr:hypothetical protein [Ramlibacter sp.]
MDASMPSGRGLEAEYEGLIASQCHSWGIADDVVTIEVRQIGRAPDGRDVYLGMVRLAQWERDSALRLLLGLPLLEAKIRKMVRALWLGEVSHFGGLWLHASEQLNATPAMRELRELLMQLTPPTMPRPGDDGGADEPVSGIPISSLQPLSHAPSTTAGAPLGPATASLEDRKPDSL